MRPPFFAFYPADFANDLNVEAMSTLQVGAYLLLLCKAWQADPPASLPNDDQILARFARVDAAVWQEIKLGVLVPFRLGSDGRLHSRRLRLEYDEALKRIKAKKDAGKRGAAGRWAVKDDAAATTDSSAIATALADALPTHCDRNAIQSQSLPSEDRSKSKTKTPLPPAKPGGGTRSPPRLNLAPPGPEPGFDPAADLADSAVEPVEAWGELVREWVAARLPGFDAPGGIQRTQQRRGWWQVRLRDADWRSRWREAVRRAGRSAACRGENPGFMTHGLWLDSFLKQPDMLIRLLEGQFDDKAAGAGKTKREAGVEEVIREYAAKQEAARQEAAKRKAG